MLSICIGGIPNLVSSDSDLIISCNMSSSSYFKTVNNFKISLSIDDNVSLLFITSSFNLSVSFISSFPANLHFISSS